MARKLKVLEQMVVGANQAAETSLSKRKMLKRYGSADNGDLKDVKSISAGIAANDDSSDVKIQEESKVNENRIHRPMKGLMHHNLGLGAFHKQGEALK